MTTRKDYLRGPRIDPRPITGKETVTELVDRSEEHTSELQSRLHLVCRLLLEKKKKKQGASVARLVTHRELRQDRRQYGMPARRLTIRDASSDDAFHSHYRTSRRDHLAAISDR